MPVSDAFRSRREGKRGLRTFCGFAWRPTGVAGPKEAVLGYRGRAMNREAARCDDLLFAVADGLGGPRRRGMGPRDHGAILRRPRRAGSRRRIPRVPTPQRPTRQITEDHAIGDFVVDAASSRRSSHGTWTAGQAFGLYRLAGSAGHGRYLQCSGGLSPVVDDRPLWNVLTLRAASADPSASGPSRRGRASVSRSTPYRCARPGMRGKPAPAPADRRGRAPADQRDMRVPRDAWRHARPRLPARCARADWRTIAVTMCPGKSGHKQGPLDHPPRSPRGQGPCNRNPP